MVENLDSILNFMRLCRCCGLEHNLMYDIFSSTCSNAQTYYEVIMECAPVQLYRNDGLPSLICRKCVLILESFVLFRNKCVESEFIFKQMRNYIFPDGPEVHDSNQDIQNDPTVDNVKEETDDMCDTTELDDFEESSLSERSISNNEIGTDSYDERSVSEIETCSFEDPISVDEESIGNDCDEPEGPYGAENRTYVCGKLFERELNLAGEQKIHASEEPYSCDEYEKAFPSKSDIDEHRKIHTDETPVACIKCDRSVTLKSLRSRDQETLTGKTQFSCDECRKSSAGKPNLDRHRTVRTREKPFSCDKCEKTFFFRWKLTQHQRRAHESHPPFSCSECRESFALKSSFDEHRKTHADEKPYSCDTRGRSYDYGSTLVKREKIRTGVKRHPCDKCGKSFTSRWKLKRHQRNVHKSRVLFSCSECRQPFVLKSNFDEHRKTHADEKPYSYDDGSTLVEHEKTHKGVKPHRCDKCGKLFNSGWKLRRHQNVHNGPYSCSECHRSFKIESYFRRHRKSHADQKSYPCNRCDKSFVSRWKLDRHRNVHRRSYTCSECRRSFKNRSDLYEHRKTHGDDCAKNSSRVAGASDDQEVPVTETPLRKSSRRKTIRTLPVQ